MEGKLFSPFFQNVSFCLELMKRTGTVVSGSAVFSIISQNEIGEGQVLTFLIHQIWSECQREWNEFFQREGYEFSMARGQRFHPRCSVSLWQCCVSQADCFSIPST